MSDTPNDMEAFSGVMRKALREAYMRGWSDAIIAVYKENLGERWLPEFAQDIERIMLQSDNSNTDSTEWLKKSWWIGVQFPVEPTKQSGKSKDGRLP